MERLKSLVEGNHLVLSEKIKGVIYEFYRDKKDRHHKT